MKAQQIERQVAAIAQSLPVTDKAVRLLAGSIFRQLQNEGCQPKDIINVSTQLLDFVTSELTKEVDE